MKKQLITLASVLAVAMTGFSSCEDMLDSESSLVMNTDDNKLNTANDTLYSVMGVIKLMQKVADRTNLLGEVRGDLVTVNEYGTTALRDVAEFTADEQNPYNRPQDYYAIINNCNYFINTADESYSKRGQAIFKKEMAVMKTYRAWAYLQLAMIYKEVPFITEFIESNADAERLMKEPRKGMSDICSFLIEDLAPYVDTPYPGYGSVGGLDSKKFFIPVRVMLGDLCLWSNRYEEAAQYYHDYMTVLNEEVPIGSGRNTSASWNTISNPPTQISTMYKSLFTTSQQEMICYIPMENTEADGLISELPEIYNSTTDNYYYFGVTKSQALIDLSAQQNYCYVFENANNKRDTIIVCPGDTVYDDSYKLGDLRIFASIRDSYFSQSSSSKYSEHYQVIEKVMTSAVSLYRRSYVYMRYAEALNRAGYPSAAFAVLKYGLYQDTYKYVSPQELAAAGSLLTFSQYAFTKENTCGVHARGCGDVDADTLYVLPMPETELSSYEDTVAYQIPLVEDLICEEMALETCFEGCRYYDLLRIASRRNDVDYLASRVAARNGADLFDASLYAKLQNANAWYLPLVK